MYCTSEWLRHIYLTIWERELKSGIDVATIRHRGIIILICNLILAADRPYRILKRNSTQVKV
ncbi:hypothetical protein NIES2101_04550 [Calothrix sp. HK-06]|nr:hypothetical protein NIES2101_04550 [Calothrix sp. HK-06]